MTKNFLSPKAGRLAAAAAALCLLLGSLRAASAASRAIPAPLPSHPGNIFLAGEPVSVSRPSGEGQTWRAVDYEGKTVAEGPVQEGRAQLGRLPVGYYEVTRGTNLARRVSLGVLASLRAPTPRTSPIGIDVAMAWLYPPEKMADVASLCALAGVNRVRDRLHWAEMELQRGTFATTNRYDGSARAQSGAGLQVLQVNHVSPGWANPNGKRFPPDLRDAYRFYREMARRWRGQVDSFEPWNEADLEVFGGHTGSEMAAMQKASYLGLKAGNPKARGCLNVFAIHRASTLRDFQDNEAWPYFDTFDLHHYEPFDNYPRLYADFRAVSAGKPLWVTECSLPVQWQGDERAREPGEADLRVQAERVPMTFALTLHEGAQAVFYFMLPHYTEGQTQFGILRPDLTPRPGYLALAAAGRLLADAQPLGALKAEDSSIHGCLFRAKPDGRAAEVLVVWSRTNTPFSLPQAPKACFDHLGRSREPAGGVLQLSPAPLYVVLAKGTRLPLAAPPKTPKRLPGKPSLLVLQAVVPERDIALKGSAYQITTGQPNSIPVFLYNFGTRTATGRLSTSLRFDSQPAAAVPPWRIEFPTETTVAPGERKELRLCLSCSETNSVGTVRIAGDFGRAGKPVLSVRFAPISK